MSITLFPRIAKCAWEVSNLLTVSKKKKTPMWWVEHWSQVSLLLPPPPPPNKKRPPFKKSWSPGSCYTFGPIGPGGPRWPGGPWREGRKGTTQSKWIKLGNDNVHYAFLFFKSQSSITQCRQRRCDNCTHKSWISSSETKDSILTGLPPDPKLPSSPGIPLKPCTWRGAEQSKRTSIIIKFFRRK